MSRSINLNIPFLLFLLLYFFRPLSDQNLLAQENYVRYTDLKLNRKAVILSGDKKKEFPLAQQGFLWQKDDSKTQKWRPQGITGTVIGNEEYIFVSWYGRPKNKKNAMDYRDRGTRISVVNVTRLKKDPSANNYRHILLVDKGLNTFYNMHAGGIAWVNGRLHVADSRKGHGVIRVFSPDRILELPDSEKIHGYKYVMKEMYSYKSPVKPSYISFDAKRKKILVGAFIKEPSEKTPNTMAWFTPPQNKLEAAVFSIKTDSIPKYRLPDKYKKLQGMVSRKGEGNKETLWLSTSYGADHRSNFYQLSIDRTNGLPTSPTVLQVNQSKTRKYPPGLEDIYPTEKQLWLLTEFAYAEGVYLKVKGKPIVPTETTRRAVFAINQSDVTPK